MHCGEVPKTYSTHATSLCQVTALVWGALSGNLMQDVSRSCVHGVERNESGKTCSGCQRHPCLLEVQSSLHIDASINDKDACTTLFYTSRAAAAAAAAAGASASTCASRQPRPVAAQAAPVLRNPASPDGARPPNPRDPPSSISGSVWSHSLGGSPGQLSPEQSVVGTSSQPKLGAAGRAVKQKIRPSSGPKNWALGKGLPTSIPEEEMHMQDIHETVQSNPGGSR